MVTIIASTNRPNSSTLKLAQYYQRQLAAKGMQTNLLSLTQLPPNLIETDLYGKRSEAFTTIQNQITATEKFLFIIPEYNGSYPGVLKVFVDACSFPESFYDKKAALVGLSSGKYGNIRGIDHFTGVCHYLNLQVMPLKLHIASIRKEMDEQGNLTAEDTLRFTNEQIDKFIRF
ncbi:NAD(P)H-dependent oxidoreductase [Mucilaginibacter sp. 14171R-50]|uniref:NADPH-dependent FMN reductase n=1 Tax=Mucilaginibacter sp. 14171R-50 TaxID=2703789 RepID=UPI00138DC342|nr:NADPH-dependent FMN reductase [Mucilaginibacter sp. 14171R-50]QHS55518.1 NAD(P)H-dependent oxidoreductase [Mucilaginibacter sp. 14171R-50]